VKVIADIAIALEFTEETLINPDIAIEMQESIAGTLQSLDEVNRKDIADVFESISALYNGEIADYVRSLPANYGIK
jgi:signal recognition particle GTPase